METAVTTIKEQVSEILVAHNLDFTIQKTPLIGNDGRITPYFGLFNSKSNECINTTKDSYCVSQNDELVEMVLRGIESFGANLRVSKAGSLNGGRKVFIQLAIEGLGKVANDVIERFVTIIDSNDGSTSLSIGIGDKTMSCANQFFKFYKAGDAKFRHTATIAQKIKTIPMLIETALAESLKQIEVYNVFASTQVSKDLADAMVKHVLGFDRQYTSMDVMAEKSTRSINKMDMLYKHIEKEMAQKGQNLWGLHSGVTSFTTHEISTAKRDVNRIESSIIGGGYKMNQASLKFAMGRSGLLEMA